MRREDLDSRDPEVEQLRRRLDSLTRQVAANNEKLKRSQARELRLLACRDLGGLFVEMIDGLKESYGLDYVSVVLADPDHDVRHLLTANGSSAEEIDGLILVESLGGMAPQYVALRQPWLGAFAACDHQLLFPDGQGINSVALIPLSHGDNLMGSINFGSSELARFTAGHAVDFFAHLGVIASFCIENTVNRARLLRSGFTDVLTGWHNRRYLQVRLREELARAMRDATTLVCLMIDIDHFKSVNDSFGHVAGDHVLAETAARIETQVRASDVAARFGGEEFIVLMPESTLEAGEALAERIRTAVSQTPIHLPGGGAVPITISAGVASSSVANDCADLKPIGDSLMARADVALYRAKTAGRDRVMREA